MKGESGDEEVIRCLLSPCAKLINESMLANVYTYTAEHVAHQSHVHRPVRENALHKNTTINPITVD